MEIKRIAVFLGHPAHYHMFKYVTADLESKGIRVDYLVKRKDVLEDLVQQSGHPYQIVRNKERAAKGRLGLACALIEMEMNVTRYLLKNKPDLLLGTYAPVISHLTGVPMIICCEDDTSVVPRFARTSYPYAAAILAPRFCDGGKWDAKMIKYEGFQKLAYLHPNRFSPQQEVIAPYLRNPGRPYVLIRFAKLQAHHDEGIGGLTNRIALDLIKMLTPRYDVYITSERSLSEELEPYRLQINPWDIHHVLAFASFYLGDSQSMAVESAMLGTPCLRFSDFAGKIGVLEELEHKYGLTCAISASEPEKLFEIVKEWINMPDLREIYQQRRNIMLKEKIDVSSFFRWFIENYPESKEIMLKNPEYQWRFK